VDVVDAGVLVMALFDEEVRVDNVGRAVLVVLIAGVEAVDEAVAASIGTANVSKLATSARRARRGDIVLCVLLSQREM
jgi:hypothetical protein